MATGKRDNVRTSSPDGGATRNISNPDLAARLKAYQNRTGEFKNKKGGAKFTQPEVGKRTEKRTRAETNAAGRNYAKTYRANAPQRKARGEAYRADEVKRREEYAKTGRVTTGVGRDYGQVPAPAPQVGSGGSGYSGPSSFGMGSALSPQGMGPQTPPGYYPLPGSPPSPRAFPTSFGPQPRPSMFNSSGSIGQQPMQPQSQYMQPLPQSGYMPPQGGPGGNPVSQGAYNFGQQLGQMYNNPWGRKW